MKPRFLPKFPIFVQDWLSSARILAMTAEQRGGFLHLLLLQWQEGGLPADELVLLRLAGIHGSPADHPLVLEAFPVDVDGQRRNGKCAAVRLEAEAYYAEQTRKSALGVYARRRQPAGQPTGNPAVNPRSTPPTPTPTPTPETDKNRDTSGVPSVSSAPAARSAAKNGHVSEHQVVADLWCRLFLETTGNEYAFEGAKDGAHVRAILGYAKGDLALIETRMRALLSSQDPFFAEKGVNLSTLRSCWNKLASAGRPSRGQPTFESAFEANMRDMKTRLERDGILPPAHVPEKRKAIQE